MEAPMRRTISWPTQLAVTSAILLLSSSACQGVIGVNSDAADGLPPSNDDALRRAICFVEPLAVVAGENATAFLHLKGKPARVRFEIETAANVFSTTAWSGDTGWASVAFSTSGVGPGQVQVYLISDKRDRFLAECAFTVVIAPSASCGDGVCDTNEDCGACADDCGTCPAVCGDGTCDDTEDCDACAADCGGCPAVCGDGTCDDTEDCNACAADCGACPTGGNCGDGTCSASEQCDTCAADCGSCIGPAPSLVRGPYLQVGSSETMVVKWRTLEPTGSVVMYGPNPGNLIYRAESAGSQIRHEVQLTGLSPSTKYFYGFGTSERTLHGKDASYSFMTSPPVGQAKATRIWVVGDSGKVGTNQQDVLSNYLHFTGERSTDLWLMLGDNAYSDGKDSEYQVAVFDAYPTMLRNTVVWTTLGNHDDCLDRTSASSCNDLPESLDGATPYYEIFTLPTAGEAGGTPSGTEVYNSFDYGNIHLVNLNSETHASSSAMANWLEADLSSTNADWIIAYWHHPPYSNGSHNSDFGGTLSKMREIFLPILESYGVDLVFTGHSHSYERSAFLNRYYGDSSTFDPSQHVVALSSDGSIADGDPNGDGAYFKPGLEGAVYSVVGSSSKVSSSDYPTSYWTCKDNHLQACPGGPLLPGMVIYLEQMGSVVVDIDGNVADILFLEMHGSDDNYSITDRFRIVK